MPAETGPAYTLPIRNNLSAEQLRRIREIWDITQTEPLESFEVGFTCHPDTEIAIWERIATWTKQTIHHVPSLKPHRTNLACAYCAMITNGAGTQTVVRVMQYLPTKQRSLLKRFLRDAEAVASKQD